MSDPRDHDRLMVYPQRAERKERWQDRLWETGERTVERRLQLRPGRLQEIVREVAAEGQTLSGLGDTELTAAVESVRGQLRSLGATHELSVRAFALIREVSERTIGQRHYDSQIIGGWVMLHGKVAEMETGEGKTLTATLAAGTMAMTGIPVHVITVNDYLAERDAEWMGAIYKRLGLQVGVIKHGLQPQERQSAYRCDVTYCCNKEIVFDYLRDRIALGSRPSKLHLQLDQLCGAGAQAPRLLLRGLHFAIVDEADSVLVDEARTPLIISESSKTTQERDAFNDALALSESLTTGTHFRVENADRSVNLTNAGKARLELYGRRHGGLWKRRQVREQMVSQALTATHLYKRDRHYLVRDDKIEIIDEYTGRTMPDRSWEHGLHQAIQAKEDCEVTVENNPVARISYQRFFRRYLTLCGMTGTAREVASELGKVYGLGVIPIPSNRPLRRKSLGRTILASEDAKWDVVVARVAALHTAGRPVLVGTRSVEASERLSERLRDKGLTHKVLNARQDEHEAEIIGNAGQRAQITVATNMAGRGTDIKLADGMAALGGLHVIITEHHDARRIDRQLSGRCGRQGDPGSFEIIVSLEDELITTHASKLRKIGTAIASPLFALAQRRAERRHSIARQDLLRMDIQLDTTLAFAGGRE